MMDAGDTASNASPDVMDHDHAASSCDPVNSDICPTDTDGKEEALDFLRSLLNKNLRVITTDGRMFWGALKCTDPVFLSNHVSIDLIL
jgi:hypothetical protein